MIRSQTEWEETVDRFHAAAVGAASWDAALRGLARVTGSKHGELLGFGPEGMLFDWVTDMDEVAAREFAAANGHDPRVNSRVRVGSRTDELIVLSEADFDTPGDMRRHPDYGEFIRKYDIPFVALTTLARNDGLLIGLTAMRSQREGEIQPDQRRAFQLLAPHVRTAALTHLAVAHQAAALVAGAMEAFGGAVFVCDFQGRVGAMSPAAEALLADGRLRVQGGRLLARSAADANALATAIHQACAWRTGPAPPPSPLVLRDGGADGPLLIEVAPLPRQGHAFGLGLGALVMVRTGRRSDEYVASCARALFGLTRMESVVLAGLVAGRQPLKIADDLAISIETVRTHIRRTFDKVGVHSTVELIAAVTARL